MFIHVDYALDISELPENCIHECTVSGDVGDIVEFWRKELDFTVDRSKAIECLSGYGAWDDEQLEAMSDTDIAERILWLACGDFREFQYWRTENPNEPEENASCGSTVFVLE